MWLFLSSRSLHTSGALVTGVQTGALPIGVRPGLLAVQVGGQDSAHALILSCGMPRSCIANIGTQAKASLTSNRSTSLIDQPVLASSLLIAPTGATVKSFGSCACAACATSFARSEEHTSELQSLMRISYAVFCLKKKKNRRHPRVLFYSKSKLIPHNHSK